MKQLKPRTILVIGIPSFFLAFAAPFAFWADTMRDVYVAAIGGVAFTILAGLPIIGTMALVSRWSYPAPDDDPVTLDRRYRHVERNLACAGMLSLGYMIGWFANSPLFLVDENPSSIQFFVSLILLLASMFVMMVVAIAKIGIVRRLEVLKDRMKAAKDGKTNKVSVT